MTKIKVELDKLGQYLGLGNCCDYNLYKESYKNEEVIFKVTLPLSMKYINKEEKKQFVIEQLKTLSSEAQSINNIQIQSSYKYKNLTLDLSDFSVDTSWIESLAKIINKLDNCETLKIIFSNCNFCTSIGDLFKTLNKLIDDDYNGPKKLVISLADNLSNDGSFGELMSLLQKWKEKVSNRVLAIDFSDFRGDISVANAGNLLYFLDHSPRLFQISGLRPLATDNLILKQRNDALAKYNYVPIDKDNSITNSISSISSISANSSCSFSEGQFSGFFKNDFHYNDWASFKSKSSKSSELPKEILHDPDDPEIEILHDPEPYDPKTERLPDDSKESQPEFATKLNTFALSSPTQCQPDYKLSSSDLFPGWNIYLQSASLLSNTSSVSLTNSQASSAVFKNNQDYNSKDYFQSAQSAHSISNSDKAALGKNTEIPCNKDNEEPSEPGASSAYTVSENISSSNKALIDNHEFIPGFDPTAPYSRKAPVRKSNRELENKPPETPVASAPTLTEQEKLEEQKALREGLPSYSHNLASQNRISPIAYQQSFFSTENNKISKSGIEGESQQLEPTSCEPSAPVLPPSSFNPDSRPSWSIMISTGVGKTLYPEALGAFCDLLTNKYLSGPLFNIGRKQKDTVNRFVSLAKKGTLKDLKSDEEAVKKLLRMTILDDKKDINKDGHLYGYLKDFLSHDKINIDVLIKSAVDEREQINADAKYALTFSR